MGRTDRVGEVAKMFGVSVRTLHHYDERGLLVPSQRSEAGYRLYAEDDLSRLVEILALRGLGLSLARIASLLDRPGADPERALRVRRMAVRRQIADLEALDSAITAAIEQQHVSGTWSWELRQDRLPAPRMSEEELEDLMEKYYTAEHLEAFERLGQEAGPEEISAVEHAWAELIPEVRAVRDAGIDPADARAQELGRRWGELVERTFRGETGLRDAVGAAYQAGAFASDPSLPNQADFAGIAAVEAARTGA